MSWYKKSISLKEDSEDNPDRFNLEEWHKKQMAEHGWYCHMVGPDETGMSNYHTHGLKESFNHPDLQFVLPIRPDIAQGILSDMVKSIEEGEKFEPGKRYSRVIRNFDVAIISASESGRQVLRIILPDPNGNLDRGSMQDVYARQYD
jgi:hypothetical protein